MFSATAVHWRPYGNGLKKNAPAQAQSSLSNRFLPGGTAALHSHLAARGISPIAPAPGCPGFLGANSSRPIRTYLGAARRIVQRLLYWTYFAGLPHLWGFGRKAERLQGGGGGGRRSGSRCDH